MKPKTLVIALFVLALFASTAMAGPGYGVPPVSNLTPEQVSKIQAIQQAYLKDVAPLQQQLLAKRIELRAAWLSENPDQSKINALQTDILNLSAKIQEKATKARLEMIKILTPEQRAQIAAYGIGMGWKGFRMRRW